ncbi:hypothetical protein HMF8227_01716 [Saliniradius amylolyticus]|uniref:Uncharacterized protein n=1 Tax=Saliniradius amylolyticus TaxID=2183582 RepID=A0A2S2E3M0_9ALTE|nr:hypothetical protein [Saliniradius amylolyticus]AWL12189.1 hypothetical protein HMF8227_01716 [Saliniradius amylolyticus]
MCSTPKSNMAARKPKTQVKGFMQEMDAEQRAGFAEKANQAEERRQQRLARQRRQRERERLKEQENHDGFWGTIWQWLH